MELCSNGHDEVCYEGGRNSGCPACSCMADLEKEKERAEDLGETTADLRDEIAGMVLAHQAEVDLKQGCIEELQQKVDELTQEAKNAAG